MTSPELMLRRCPASSRYWNSVWPGRSWQPWTLRARIASSRSIACMTPLLARKRKRTRRPRTATWRSRSVVSPKDPLARAYSSLPTRMCVRSSSATTVARTRARESGSRRRSAATRRRICGSTRANASIRAYLVSSRTSVHLRVIAVLLAAARVAAGGLDVRVGARRDPHALPRRRESRVDRIRASVAVSRTGRPSTPR